MNPRPWEGVAEPAPVPYLRAPRFSPDGRTLAFVYAGDIWFASPQGGEARLDVASANHGRAGGRGGPLPGGASRSGLGDPSLADRQFRLAVDTRCRNMWPMWTPDGAALLFVSDRDGAENLWQQPLDGSEARPITRLTEGRMLHPHLSPDGATVVFERDFGLWRADTRSGECAPLEIRVHPDTTPTPVTHFRQGDRLSELALAPDGQKVIFGVHGKLFADFADKKDRPRNDSFPVSSTAARESQADWSPDSRKVVYLSDRGGEKQLYLHRFVTREERRLTG